MVDIAAIAGLATSFRSIVEITKTMKDVHDANVIQTKVFELTREIMSAQAFALAAQTAQSELLESKRELEAKYPSLKHGMHKRAATSLKVCHLASLFTR
jgi:hypothetical protein